MPISQAALEECVLCLLCFHQEASLIATKIEDSLLFSNRTNQTIAKTALNHIKKYGTPPNGTIDILLESDYRRGEEGRLLAQSIELLKKNSNAVQKEFVLEELDKFLKIRQLSNTTQAVMEALSSGDLDGAQELLYKNVIHTQDTSDEITLLNPRQAFSFLDRNEDGDYFPSGVDFFDKIGLRPERKTLITLIAPKGKGKTWWATAVGKGAMQHRKRPLHITLEVSAKKMACRYLQAIFSLTQREAEKIQVSYFNQSDDGTSTIELGELERDSVVHLRPDIENKLRKMTSCPSPIIKEFPTGTLTTHKLRMYLDQLQKERNLEFDEIIIDYPDLMSIDRESLRIDLGRQFVDLRGIAGERNVAMVVPTQTNRDGADAKIVKSTNVGEAWEKICTSDGVFTYSRTEFERKSGLARLFAEHFRDSADGQLILISQCYDLGQFCLDSTPMNTSLSNTLQALNDDKK